jgi:hypothetical protein
MAASTGIKRQGRPVLSALEKLKKEALKTHHELNLLNKEVQAMLCLSDDEKESERGMEINAILEKRMDVAKNINDVDKAISELKKEAQAQDKSATKKTEKRINKSKALRKKLLAQLSNLPAIGLTAKEWLSEKTGMLESDEGTLGRPGIPVEVKIIRANERIDSLLVEINALNLESNIEKPFDIESAYNPKNFTTKKVGKQEASIKSALKDYSKKVNITNDLVFGELSKNVYDDTFIGITESKGRPKKDLSIKIEEAMSDEAEAISTIEKLFSRYDSDEDVEASRHKMSSELAKSALKHAVIDSQDINSVIKAKNILDEIITTQDFICNLESKLEAMKQDVDKKQSSYKKFLRGSAKAISSIKEARQVAIANISSLELAARKDAADKIASLEVNATKAKGDTTLDIKAKVDTNKMKESMTLPADSLDSAIEASSRTLDDAEFNKRVDERSDEMLKVYESEIERLRDEMIQEMLSGQIDPARMEALTKSIADIQKSIQAA